MQCILILQEFELSSVYALSEIVSIPIVSLENILLWTNRH